MNSRRGSPTTVAAVRCRRCRGEARAIRRGAASAAVGGKRARDPVRRAFVFATPPIVKGSEKLSVCQGQAAFGGCFANLDSLPFFTWASCVGLR